jgi:hypothetical protein
MGESWRIDGAQGEIEGFVPQKRRAGDHERRGNIR